MKAFVNPGICIGCTLCIQNCPAIFKMDKDKAMAFVNPVPQEDQECAKKAAEECPVQAITLIM